MPQKKRPREYRFKIEAYSPETMPLGFLTDCLKDLIEILGNEKNLHLMRVDRSSACPVIWIDPEIEPEIKERARELKKHAAPPMAMEATARLNRRLRLHNTTGEFAGPQRNNVIIFPGVEPPVTEYGPFAQLGTLDGVPVMIGGKSDPVPVHLEGRNGEPYNCQAARPKAKEIAPYLFTTIIRAHGTGKWIRKAEGTWKMESFLISGFDPLCEIGEVSLKTAIEELRAIPAEWKELDDPIGELKRIRYGS